MDTKILKFPGTEDKKEVEENQNGKELNHFICVACGYEQKDDEKLIGFNLGPIPTIVCPYCRTLQIPELIYEGIHRQITSNIIVP